ncbi:hypothetical protein AYO44_10145 [Planctomycetaceae bacterium SCGC AG-212-F19]|nr:hypothetical protein AYO44_10145 [Planctomycetaceae bacterium SCGC AG-212-F19]
MKPEGMRTGIMFLVLMLLVLVALGQAAFLLGWTDRWVRHRTQHLAQYGVAEWDNRWCGVTLQQYPEDLMIYQTLIWDVQPDVVIETGTYCGGNALYLANLLEVIKPDAKVLTVDIDASNWKKTLAEANFPGKERLLQRIHFFEGSSTDPAVIAKMKEHIGKDAKVMVLLDSDHSRQHVLNELKAYAPLVTVNSYLIVNDTQWGSPLDAVHDLMATTDAFVVDAAVDKFAVSCGHGGFLKRVK